MLKVVKEYPPRGPMQQFRLEKAAAFQCFRCGRSKKAKLRTVYGGDRTRTLCNGCYGRLLSIYDVKAGTGPDDEKADQLAQVLLTLATEDQARQAAERLRLASNPVDALTPLALRFLGTAEFVAQGLDERPGLDWSPAVIGFCKAVEVEVVERLVEPLKRSVTGLDLREDVRDRDLGRVARYCAGGTSKPPEIGVVRHFFLTAANSKRRAESSQILLTLKTVSADWPGTAWLMASDGLLGQLATLATGYRNKAAHTGDLSRVDFVQCRDLVVGETGLMWRLVTATSR